MEALGGLGGGGGRAGLRQAEPIHRAAAGAQRGRRAAQPRREGRTRSRGARRRSPQPPPGDPQVSLCGCWAVGRGLGAPGSPGWQAGGAAGAPESWLALSPLPGALERLLANLKVGGHWDVRAEETSRAGGLNWFWRGWTRATWREGRTVRRERGLGRPGAGWCGMGRLCRGCGSPAENSRRGKAGCLRGLGWERRESAVWGAQ